jgi:hypothetical protein
MRITLRAVSLLLILSVAGVSTSFAQKEEAAEKAAREWLSLVDSTNTEASWESAGTMLKAAITAAQWKDALAAARAQVGLEQDVLPLSRELAGAGYTQNLPNIPPGEYVVLQFNVNYPARAVVETVTMALEGDVWKVIGYYIRPA